jgi:predicted ATPase
MGVREAFDADVEMKGPDPSEWGHFLVKRHEDVDHEAFLRLVSNRVGGDEFVLLDSPGGVVIVTAPFALAERLRQLPQVARVGGVTVDPDRFRRAFMEGV